MTEIAVVGIDLGKNVFLLIAMDVSAVAAPRCLRRRSLRVDRHVKTRSAFRNVRKEFVFHGAWC